MLVCDSVLGFVSMFCHYRPPCLRMSKDSRSLTKARIEHIIRKKMLRINYQC